MCAESSTSSHSSTALAEKIVPRSPWRVTAVEVLPAFQLRVFFADGLAGIVDLAGLVHSPRAGVFAALADPALFAQVTLEYGAVSWPGDVDLAPDAMHSEIQKHEVWTL